MCCCAMDVPLSRRQWLWTTLMASAATLVTNRVHAQEPVSAEALALLKANPSVDVHTHGGPQGISTKNDPTDAIAKSMRAGGLSTLCFAEVPDGPLLGRDPK